MVLAMFRESSWLNIEVGFELSQFMKLAMFEKIIAFAHLQNPRNQIEIIVRRKFRIVGWNCYWSQCKYNILNAIYLALCLCFCLCL